MTEGEFQERAEQAIADLDAAYSRVGARHDVEADLEGSVLRVTFEEPEHAVFVVSPNAPARQIWVSARLTSFKFDWLEAERRWGLSGTREPLREVMQRLTREQLGDSDLAL